MNIFALHQCYSSSVHSCIVSLKQVYSFLKQVRTLCFFRNCSRWNVLRVRHTVAMYHRSRRWIFISESDDVDSDVVHESEGKENDENNGDSDFDFKDIEQSDLQCNESDSQNKNSSKKRKLKVSLYYLTLCEMSFSVISVGLRFNVLFSVAWRLVCYLSCDASFLWLFHTIHLDLRTSIYAFKFKSGKPSTAGPFCKYILWSSYHNMKTCAMPFGGFCWKFCIAWLVV